MRREEFVSLVLTYEGYPSSRYLGSDKGGSVDGFDCSSFVRTMLLAAHYPSDIPRHSNEQFDSLGVHIHLEARQPGDLVFFTRDKGLLPRHVGIMVTKDTFIHSPGKDGLKVCIEAVKEELIAPTGSQEQLYFHNPIGYKRIMVADEGRYKLPFLN